MRRHLRSDRGAILVESALVLPVLLLLFLALADLGNLSLQRSQASSAARDGARTAILHYECADSVVGACSSSTDSSLITTAVTRRLASLPGVVVSTRCLAGGSLAAETCLSASVDTDLVEVTVSWPGRALSFIGSSFVPSRVSAVSRMAIVGLPLSLPSTTSTTAPPGCASVGAPSLTLPSSLKGNSGGLSGPITVTVASNGSSLCASATWRLVRTGGPTFLASPYLPSTLTSTQAVFTLGANDGWSAGGYAFIVTLNGSMVGTISLTIS